MDDEKILELLEQGVLVSPDMAGEAHVDVRPGAPLVANRENTNPVTVLSSYTKKSHKRTYDDFVSYFNRRFKLVSGLLKQRQELAGATSIARLKGRGRERAAVIAMVNEKSVTKNDNILLTLEDQTGTYKAVVTKRNEEAFTVARDVVLDEVIGLTGVLGDGILFADSVIVPDIPVTHELRKGPVEEYVAIVGDTEVGGKDFLRKDFEKMLAWLRGEVGNEEQRAIAAKVKYVIFIGDLVAGVGVYPGQEAELSIKDIKEQYAGFTEYLKRVPERMSVILIPGNHDAGRLAEPQLPIYRDFAQELYAMPNVTSLSNPCWVRLGAHGSFPGFDFLLYHGASLIYYSDNVPSIRERGGQKRSELIMKFLLQRRHLAPSHGSNLYIPDPDQDPLFLDRVPDFFITGHIHRVASATYRGVTMVNASAWSDITDAQIRRGLEPQPSRIPVINLRTRDVKVINFYTGKLSGVAP